MVECEGPGFRPRHHTPVMQISHWVGVVALSPAVLFWGQLHWHLAVTLFLSLWAGSCLPYVPAFGSAQIPTHTEAVELH